MSFEKLPDAFGVAEIDGEVVLISASTGEFFATKGTGAEIWHLLDQTGDLAAIAESLTERFAIDGATAQAETLEFLGQLEELGFVGRAA